MSISEVIDLQVGVTRQAPRMPRLPAGLSGVLAAVVTAASLWTYLDDGLLRGPAAMNGSARGTALVALVVAVPVLVASVVAALRGSALALLSWLGSLAFLLYNALVFLFLTPFNHAFLLYAAWLGLAAWSVATLLLTVDVAELAHRFSSAAPVRAIATYIWTVAALNALVWLASIVPALASDGPAKFLNGTGVTTNVIYVQDLALWLPLMAVIGVWLSRRRPLAYVLATGGLVLWVIESISVAVDQSYGAAADPSSSVVSASLTPPFAVLALVGLVPIGLLLRGFDREGLAAKARRLAPAPARRTAAAWVMAATSLLVAISAAFGGVSLLRNSFDMPKSWLAATPFTSWAVPGVALLATVALPQLATVLTVAFAPTWGRLAGLLAGAGLVVWILVQLLVLQRFFFLQPIIAAFGLVEVGCAYAFGARRELMVMRGPNGPNDPDGQVLDLR